jgi:hypothetical protein
VKFTVAETVEPAKRDVRDQNGNILTHEGDAVRTLTLSGLNLEDKYILITTDFESGKPDFTNSGLALLTAYDEQGREIPGVVASGGTIWAGNLVDFRNKGLVFDYGWGSTPISLDAPNASGKNGFLAFARGRNAYLPGALCETEPKVQEFWLKCLDEIIAAGVDGVDFRDENHSTHTDHPEEYGFNPAVLAKAQARPGNLLKNIADVRGEAYTEFLRECHRRLSKAGIPMRYNLQLDFYRPNPPANRLLAYPANINFQWQRWIDEGMLEGSILRFFSLPFGSLFDDSIARDMIARSQKRDMKITVNRYIEVPGEKLTDEVLRIKSDGRFDGYIFYETGSYIKYGPNPGDCSVNYPLLIKATTAARGL